MRRALDIAALLALAALAALALPVAPAAALDAVWVVPGGEKVFPDSVPRPLRAVELRAASGEYEAAQVAVSDVAAFSAEVRWSPGSDPFLVANGELFRVGYVNVTQPSSCVGSQPGLYPDPLLPATFDVPVTLPPGTSSFYLRLHVPPGTPAGDHAGTLEVEGPWGLAIVPVELHVWDFGWRRTSLHTALPFSIAKIMRSVAGVVEDTPENENLLCTKYYEFWAEHDLSVTALKTRPTVDKETGHLLDPQSFVDAVTPYLGGPAYGDGLFLDSTYPLVGHFPWGRIEGQFGTQALATYVGEMFDLYRSQGWDRTSYFYVYDEPGLEAEYKSEALARIVHAAAEERGFRARYLLTDWPRPRPIGGREANAFLFDDIDIWAPSFYRYFTALPALEDRRAAGSEIWWYGYTSWRADRFPTYLIDEPLSEERTMGWLTWRWGATGLIHWGTTRWGDPVHDDGYRDPYFNPVSYAGDSGWRSNGEACLIYPGYEPALGLTDPYAGPVSSLRMESLRDGIEDYEYLRLATQTRTGDEASAAAASCARQVAAASSEYPYGAHPQGYRNMPDYRREPAFYEDARLHLASYIERAQDGLAPAVVGGTVTDAASGEPLWGATVSDGVLQTTTDANGAFTLRGVLPQATLTISHPLYYDTDVAAAEGDPPLAVPLGRRPAARLLEDFELRARFAVSNGYSATSTAYASGGLRSAKVVLRSPLSRAELRPARQPLDLRRSPNLELDVYDPAVADHERFWYLYVSARDAAGRTVQERYLLRPEGWTHVSLPLGSVARRLTTIVLSAGPSGSHTVFVDTLAVR